MRRSREFSEKLHIFSKNWETESGRDTYFGIGNLMSECIEKNMFL